MKRLLAIRRESRLFVVGSALFALGALPGYAGLVGATADGVTYFVGSIFFTTASFVQLRLSGRWRAAAWRAKKGSPGWCDWWAAAIQFVGTLCFNVSTAAALIAALDVSGMDRWVWRPDVVGSFFFLLSSGIAIAATVEREGLWDPDARTWWNTWLNMAGSIAFGVSAIAAYVVPSSGEVANAAAVNAGTFVGAICFLLAALLLPPAKTPPNPATAE